MKKFFCSKKVIIVAATIYIAYTLIHQQIIMANQRKELEVWQVELEKVKEKNDILQDEVKLAQTVKYIEKQAREKLGLIKAGEIPIIEGNSNSSDSQ